MQDKGYRTSESAERERIGFFGKLPSHGDFVGWGFARDFELTLQAFLQTGLQSCASKLGSSWEDAFAGMPPWRFIVERGLWCGGTVAGVLVNSRDRVGRRFPLIVAVQIYEFSGHPRQLYLDESWFTAVEALAETANHRDFDMERFTTALTRLRRLRPADPPDDFAGIRDRVATESIWWSVEPGSRKVRGFRNSGPPRGEDLPKLIEAGLPPLSAAAQPGQGVADPDPAPLSSVGTSPGSMLPQPIGRSSSSEVMVDGSRRNSSFVGRGSSPVVPPAVHQPSPPLRCRHAYSSHSGTRTTLNADAILAADASGMFVVADGIGDGSGAVHAAKLIVHLLGSDIVPGPLEPRLQYVTSKIGLVNGLLFSQRRENTDAAVETASLVALLVGEDRVGLLWAGDARCYLIRHGMMRCLTRDHVALGLRYNLSRAVGLSDTLSPETTTVMIEPGDLFLLCSAPLVRVLGERLIAETLIQEEFSQAPAILVENSMIAGARENLTAVCVSVDHE
ncbi:type VI secretion system-associated protein TagF [Rhizobium sp. AAP43]|uniref:type VI secretion system-associated protein TagF n=1 Tax=Rhizobium sp. AAP43 TaxID=1523420 RepID=UPI0006B96C44|nr:type VI secretion system-associated protein TagF [Rhizobium sp. AAP43]KPF45780.1 hypothetical protein IP76_06710 [Rhizobium sp. AAP43]